MAYTVMKSSTQHDQENCHRVTETRNAAIALHQIDKTVSY